eukprot:8883151-Pyramimonas_sp.AAC.2
MLPRVQYLLHSEVAGRVLHPLPEEANSPPSGVGSCSSGENSHPARVSPTTRRLSPRHMDCASSLEGLVRLLERSSVGSTKEVSSNGGSTLFGGGGGGSDGGPPRREEGEKERVDPPLDDTSFIDPTDDVSRLARDAEAVAVHLAEAMRASVPGDPSSWAALARGEATITSEEIALTHVV